MNSNALQDFVQQQKSKSSNFGGGLTTGHAFSDLKEKFLNTSGLSLPSSSSTGSYFSFYKSASPSTTSDTEIDGSAKNGISIGNGTKKANGWFSIGGAKNESVFGLTRFQRIVGFILCLIVGIICFTLASFYIPVLIFKARKFAALYTLGSCFFLFSFALLWGPTTYIKHLFSAARLPMTLSYFFSLSATLYCSIWIGSTVLTVLCASVQMATLIWFLFSYVPGGETGLRWMSSLFGRLVRRQVAPSSSTTNLLPV